MVNGGGNWHTVLGLRMHYIDAGPGEGSRGTLLMLHGNPTWSVYYRRLIAHFSDRYRCIVPDHIGMGLSDKPLDSAYPYTLGQRIGDIENLLDSLRPQGPLILIGHDWGGMIAMGFARRRRQQIARLVLMNTAAFRLPQGKSLPLSLQLCRAPLLGALLVRGLNLFCRGALRQGSQHARLTPGERTALLAPYDSWAHRIAVHRFIQDIPLKSGDPAHALVQVIERGLGDFRDCPALILWGGRDFVFDDDFLEAWRRFLPQAVVHRFADAGHYVLEDAHERIIPLLEDFLASAH